MRLKCSWCFLCPLLLSAATALVVAGCGNDHDSTLDVVYNPCEPLAIEVRGEANADQLRSIDRALSMWNEAASLSLSRELVDGAPAIPVRFESGAAMIHGYYEDETGEVIINRGIADDRAREITLAHELGHAFGLWHIAENKRRSLMNAGNLDTAITEADSDALLSRWDHCAPTNPTP